MTSVQGQYVQVTSQTIAKWKEASNGTETQFDRLLSTGYIVESNGNYYVSATKAGNGTSNAIVQGKTYCMNGKGDIVEWKRPNGKATGAPQNTITVTVDSMLKNQGIEVTDANKSQFLTAIKQDQNFIVDDKGNITWNGTDATTMNTFMKTFVENNPTLLIPKDAQYTIDLEEPVNAPKIVANLTSGDSPTISNPSTDGNNVYDVSDMSTLTSVMDQGSSEFTYTVSTGNSCNLEVLQETSVETEFGTIHIPENLRTSRSARKTLENNARDGYAQLLAQADRELAAGDPTLRNGINAYIAQTRYADKIEERKNEILNSDQKYVQGKWRSDRYTDVEICEMYYERYTGQQGKSEFNNKIQAITNSTDPEIINLLNQKINQLKSQNYSGSDTELKHNAAVLLVMDSMGLTADGLLTIMATDDIMSSRTTAQIRKDDEFFIKQQAKDFVKHQQAIQDVEVTTVYFSKDARKAGEKDDSREPKGIHNDIGDKGRKLVTQCPTVFGEKVENYSSLSTTEKANCFQAADGNWYKFDEQKWKTFMKIVCDPDADGKVSKEDANILKSMNLTLNEGREILSMKFPVMTPNGVPELDDYSALHEVIGNFNGKTDNRELNALRDMAKLSGYSVDPNRTYTQRFLHVLKQAGIDGLLGFALPFAAGTIVGDVVKTGAGVTADRILNYSGTSDWRHVDKDAFTVNVNDYTINVGGTEVHTGTVDYNGEVLAEGQEYSYKTNGNNTLQASSVGGLLGIGIGTIKGLFSMGKINDPGRASDAVFNLTYKEPVVTQSNATLAFEQYTVNAERVVSATVGNEIETRDFVPYAGFYQYTAMYQIDGADITNHQLKKALGKQLKSEWAGMAEGQANGIPRQIPGIQTITFTYDGKSYTATLRSDWKTCNIEGKRGGSGGVYNINTGSSETLTGTIRFKK